MELVAVSNKAECLLTGGECECSCDCCTSYSIERCEPGTDHPIAADHSTMLCPESKKTLYKNGMVHEA